MHHDIQKLRWGQCQSLLMKDQIVFSMTHFKIENMFNLKILQQSNVYRVVILLKV